MLRRIVIENFMSHRRTVIEPAAGLTVLTGPNNCGKSAVAVALQALALNDLRGDFMVRHGEAACRVTVETDDGHVIEWRRKGSAVSYTIDGREVHRVGTDLPDGLQEVLRLPEVTAPDGKDSFNIHFAEQKRPIFLLDRPSREQALFFASSSDAALLMDMQRRHRQRAQEAKREEGEIERRIAARKRFLEALAPVEALDRGLGVCEEEGLALERAEELAARLEADRTALAARSTEDRLLALKGLEPAPPAQRRFPPPETGLLPGARDGRHRPRPRTGESARAAPLPASSQRPGAPPGTVRRARRGRLRAPGPHPRRGGAGRTRGKLVR